MIEKRRTLDLTFRINTYLFALFIAVFLILLFACFLPSNDTFATIVYKAVLFFNVFYIIHSIFVYILAIIVHIGDKVASPKIVVITTIRIILSIVISVLALLLKQLMLSKI